MSLAQKALKGVVWTAVQNWGRQVIAFAVFLLLARLLDPKTFGLISLASLFLNLMQVLTDQGFGQAIIQRKEITKSHLDTAFWTNVGISLLLIVICVVGAAPIASLFKEPTLTPIIQWLSLSFLLSGLSSVQNALLSREFQFKLLAVRSLVAVLVGGVVGLTMAFMGYGVWSLVGQQLANGVAGVIVLWSTSNWRPGWRFSRQHFRELFSFGINIVGIKLLNFFNRRSDDFLIGYFLGPVALGYYTVAYRVLRIMTQLMTSTIDQVALPTFSTMQKEPERLRRAFYKVTQVASFIAFPAFIAMAALAPELVRAFFGEQWAPSIPVMQVLAFIGILHSVDFFNATVIMAMGKPFWKLVINCLNVVCNVTAFVLVVRWGIVAVAAAYVIRGYLLFPVPLWIIHRLIRINIPAYFRQYLAPLIGSMAMVLAIMLSKYLLSSWSNPLMTVCLGSALGGGVYLATIFLFAPQLLQQVVDLARSVLPGKWRKKAV
jgi:O-antigen/teichoic acid export membrane protein